MPGCLIDGVFMLLKKFQNLSVARKMWALFLGLLLCCVLVAGGLFSYLQNVEQRVSAAVQATDKRINLALRWQALTLQSVEAALASVLSSEEHLIAQLSQKARGLMQQAGGLQQQVQADAQSEVDRSGLARVEQERKAVLSELKEETRTVILYEAPHDGFQFLTPDPGQKASETRGYNVAE